MNVLEVKNVGPIKHAKVEFGDLTILVGPQASGKSVFLQMLKLVEDYGWIRQRLGESSASLNGDASRLFDAYFGVGASAYWTTASRVNHDGVKFDPKATAEANLESVHYIPAQRAMAFTLRGWPISFSDFPNEIPYVLKDYGDDLQRYLGQFSSRADTIPVEFDELPKSILERAEDAILPGFKLRIDQSTVYRRLMLVKPNDPTALSVSMWSAGQRESIPLLMSLARYSHSSRLNERSYPDWLILEEPEMGLHPDGVMAIMGVVLYLLAKSSQVCISTHSNAVLEVAWVIRLFQEEGISAENLLKVFRLPKSKSLMEIADAVMNKRVSVFYFDREAGTTKQISRLDPGAEDQDESGWGGLTSWSGHVGNVIASALSLKGRA